MVSVCYVANFASHCVSVFTINGAYMTSFGQHGNRSGEFMCPLFVCIDKDVFVYVTDFFLFLKWDVLMKWDVFSVMGFIKNLKKFKWKSQLIDAI